MINISAPINPVSFGQVSFNVLREISKQTNFNFFPIGEINVSPYNEDKEFFAFMDEAASGAKENFSSKDSSLKIWHISGLMDAIGKKRLGFTFHETDRLTKTEVNILSQLDVVFVTSEYTKRVFENSGVTASVVNVGLGFDSSSFYKKEVKGYDDPDVVVFGLFGKMEERKNTLRILNLWANTFGNNKKFVLHAAITSPFLSAEVQKNMVAQALGGHNVWNINFLPFSPKNDDYNNVINSIDIDLTGMSSCEGFNLPAFQNLCLGKQGVFLNAHVHKDYANEDNAILVQPTNTMRPAVDNIFFKKGESFNQGYWHDFHNEEFIEAMKLAVTRAKVLNTNGILLKDKFTYKKTAENILSADIGL